MDESPLIISYTRAMAIADGVFVDIMAGPHAHLVREAGIRWPVALTSAAYAEVVALTEAAEAAGCDEAGRLWDLLSVFHFAAKRSEGNEVHFSVVAVTTGPKAVTVDLWAVVEPDEDGTPAITIMLEGED